MNLWWGAEPGSELVKMTERYAHLAPENLRAGITTGHRQDTIG
jgi:hypothetical protein